LQFVPKQREQFFNAEIFSQKQIDRDDQVFDVYQHRKKKNEESDGKAAKGLTFVELSSIKILS
jgi:hypothetical protein